MPIGRRLAPAIPVLFPIPVLCPIHVCKVRLFDLDGDDEIEIAGVVTLQYSMLNTVAVVRYPGRGLITIKFSRGSRGAIPPHTCRACCLVLAKKHTDTKKKLGVDVCRMLSAEC